jgi:hypothetical protein
MASLVPAGCLLCQRLVREYASAISDHNRIYCAYLAAILHGDDAKFEGEVAWAETRKENAFYVILAHQREHFSDSIRRRALTALRTRRLRAFKVPDEVLADEP